MPVSERMQKIVRGAKKVLARRRAAKAGQYPKTEEVIRVPAPGEVPPPGTSTYTPPAPYRVFRVVKK